MNTTSNLTIQPVVPAEGSGLKPEFARVRDLEHLFGLRRGTTYNLLEQGKIRGVLLRVKGSTSGVRLIDVASVRQFIEGQMAANN